MDHGHVVVDPEIVREAAPGVTQHSTCPLSVAEDLPYLQRQQEEAHRGLGVERRFVVSQADEVFRCGWVVDADLGTERISPRIGVRGPVPPPLGVASEPHR